MVLQKSATPSLPSYKKAADETLQRIIQIRMRVQQKVDEHEYAELLAKLQK